MNVNFASVAPAIAQFDARRNADNEDRHRRNAEYAAQLALERQRGGAKTSNEAIQAYFAAQPQPGAPAGPAAGPMPVPAPAPQPIAAAPPPPAPAAAPVVPGPVPGAGVAPVAVPPPGGAAAAPAFKNPAAMDALRAQLHAQNTGPGPDQGFGMDVAPLPPGAAGAPPAAPPAAVPASAAAAPSSPISGFSVQRAPLSQRPGFNAMMGKLTSNVDTAPQAMAMFNADRTSQSELQKQNLTMQHEGMTLFAKAATDSDIGMMRVLNQRYGLGIPPEFVNSREGMAALAASIKTVKGLGITDDSMALATAGAYLENTGKGMDPNSAMAAAMKTGQASAMPKVAGHYATPDNNVALYGTKGENIQQPGQPLPKIRPPREAGGAGSKLTLSRQDMVAALKAIGWDDKAATEAAYGVGKGKVLNEQQKAALAKQLYVSDRQQSPSRRQFESFKDAKNLVDGMYQGTPGPQPAAAPGAEPVFSPPRADGASAPKRLRFDAQGNQVQ